MKVRNSLRSLKAPGQEQPHRPPQGPHLRHQQEEPAHEGAPGLTGPRCLAPRAQSCGTGRMIAPSRTRRRRCRPHARDRRSRLRRIVPDGVVADDATLCRLRQRRADRLSPEAAGLRAAAKPPIRSRRCAALCLARGRARGAARRRHLAFGRRAAARRRDPARPVAHEPHPRDRLREPLRRRRSRASPTSPSRRRGRGRADSSMRPIRPARSPAPSAAMWRRIPAAFIA